MKRFLVFAVLIAVLYSCHTDPLPNPQPSGNTQYIPQEVNAFCYFKEGTYWIYEDSLSGQLDSVYVYYASRGFDTLLTNFNPPGIYEWFDVKTMSSRDSFTREYWCHMTYSTVNPTVKVYRDVYKPGNDVGEDFFFLSPRTLNVNYFSTYDTLIYTAQGVATPLFQNNISFYYSRDISRNEQRTVSYIKQNIGLTRIEELDSLSVLNLIRYQILQ